jgi:hypothetical protein
MVHLRNIGGLKPASTQKPVKTRTVTQQVIRGLFGMLKGR